MRVCMYFQHFGIKEGMHFEYFRINVGMPF